MGDTAEDLEVIEAEEEEVSTDAVEGEVEATEDEVEVVLDGVAPPVSEKDQIRTVAIRERRKGRAKLESVEEKLAAAEQRAKDAEDRAKLYELSLQQKQETGPPKPEDFEEGDLDPKFLQARRAYEESQIASKVEQKFAEEREKLLKAESERDQTRAVETARREHYVKAAELNLKGYEEAEDAVVDEMGEEFLDFLIGDLENPHAVIVYLSRNQDQLKGMKSLIAANQASRAHRQLVRLDDRVVIKTRSSTAPNPEETIAGGDAATVDKGPSGVTYE